MSSVVFSSYIKFEQLSDEEKRYLKIKIGAKVPRYDATYAAGYSKGFEDLRNSKGQLFLYLIKTRGIISSPDVRRADNFLQAKDSFNVSSVFIYGGIESGDITGYGNPSSSKTYGKDRKENPFYDSRNDGFLFIIANDWSSIEILTIPDGLHTILGNAKALADGQYTEALGVIRRSAKNIKPI